MIFRALFPIIVIIGLLLFLYVFFKYLSRSREKSNLRSRRFDGVRREIDHGQLHKDPVSGTYVSEGDAIVVEKKGKKYYFASKENAEQFLRDDYSD